MQRENDVKPVAQRRADIFRSAPARRKFIFVLALVMGPLIAGPAMADMYQCPGAEPFWRDQGPFVEVPAGIAEAPGSLVGGALALAFAPADLIEMSIHQVPSDQPIPRFARVGLCAGQFLGKGLGIVVGAPFWLLKEMFWDGPKYLIGGPAKAA